MVAKKAKRRLDSELVHRKIAHSREQANRMIKAGRVSLNGFPALKPATQVPEGASIKVAKAEEDRWASRGAHKLLGALEAVEPLGFQLEGRRVLDAGASTGGFTDVCLDRGAREVVAVDVGYGQLIWRLQNDDRVTVLDRTNIRYLDLERTGGACEVVVGDLSFISLTLTLPAIQRVMGPGADLLPMVKPQFEVGKDRLGHGGVVRSAQLRREAAEKVAECAAGLGLTLKAAVASPLPGPSGNVEYFLWLVNDAGAADPGRERRAEIIAEAVARGPQ